MRNRLSWDEAKVAEINKQADPYTMNQERHNPPVSKYETGDPSTWAEDPNMKTPWKTEGRTETGHPAPARQAVVAARKLEDKALKCITIAQRMLPGAVEAAIEEQATDLMYLPEKSVLATLQRQSELADKIAADDKDEEKKEEECKDCEGKKKDEDDDADAEAKKKAPKEEEVEAKKKAPKEEEVTAAKKKEEEEVEAKKKAPKEEEEVEAKKKAPKEEEVTAKKKKEEEEVEAKKAPKEEEKEAAKKKDEADAEAAKKKDEDADAEAAKKKDDEIEMGDKEADLLDQIFDLGTPEKTGAKKLSGLVKQASSGDNLSNIWDTPPDVSAAFK
jgi:DNA polymerase III gamma/tau subunit